MELTVKEVEEYLNLPEPRIYELIRSKSLPSTHKNQVYYINKTELLQWAIEHKVAISPRIFDPNHREAGDEMPTVYHSLTDGGIFYNIPGKDTVTVFRNIVQKISFSNEDDREQLLLSLVAREMLGSTSVGNGIAIPHVRNPVVLDIDRPIILLSFLETPIEFKAIDKKAVDILFTIITSTVHIHLHVLSRLSYILQKPNLIEKLKKRSPVLELLETVKILEAEIGS